MTRKPMDPLRAAELVVKNAEVARDNLRRTLSTLVLVRLRHRELLAMR